MAPSKRICVSLGVLAALVVALIIWVRLAYRGDLDSATFEIVQSQSALSNRVAILAERPGTKWSNNTFFVLIGDHLYSSAELRKALYSSQIVFEVGSGGLDIRWESPDVLIVKCVGCTITKNSIQVQKFKDKGVTIRYTDFPT